MRAALVAAAGIVLTAVVSTQQAPTRDNTTPATAPTGTSAISGIVLTTERTPQPIRRATVALTGDGTSRTTASDENGRFAFDELPAGRFTVMAARPGYVRMPYGALRYDRVGTPIVVAVGQRVTDIRIALPQGAVITGLVRDDKGQPARGVTVRLYQLGQQGGDRVLISPPVTAAGGLVSAQSDDLGSYRLYGLPAGDYIVSAVPQNTAATASQRATGAAVSRTYAPVFYPGTPVASAAALITVTAGEERANVDIPLLLVSTAGIAGRVLAPTGSPAGAIVRLVSRAAVSQSQMAFSIGVTVGDDGRFNFSGVGPGEYTVAATVTGARSPGPVAAAPAILWGQTDVSVSGTDVRDVAVPLQPALSLSGRLAFDGGPMPADIASRLRLAIGPAASIAPASQLVATIAPSGQFRINGIVPGTYRFVASLTGAGDQSWTMATAMAKGVDAIDLPFDIDAGENVSGAMVSFTLLTQEVSGVLQNAAGLPATEFTLIAFPTNRNYWRVGTRRTQTARPGTDGRFVIRGLPPGDYFIAALTDLAPNDASDPAILELIVPGAVRFALGPGEKKTQDFRLASR